jgi:hypothetical protein
MKRYDFLKSVGAATGITVVLRLRKTKAGAGRLRLDQSDLEQPFMTVQSATVASSNAIEQPASSFFE